MGASDYRRIARERLENNWGLSILVAFLAALFGGSISGSGSFEFNIGERVTDVHPVVAAVIAVIVSVVSIIAFAQFIIGGTVQLGYCHFLLKNNVDRERIIKFEEATRTSTSGKLTEDDVGRKFSVDELIRLAIVYSDNMAYRLLFRTYGRYGFNEYIKSLGIETPQLPPGYEFSTVTAHDLSVGMLDIYNYSLETDYQWYIDLLIESAPGGLIDSGTKYAAAHKYGYHGGYDGYHDTAIIYAPTPYVITIMTRVFPYSKNSGEVFEKVTQLVEEIHEKLN